MNLWIRTGFNVDPDPIILGQCGSGFRSGSRVLILLLKVKISLGLHEGTFKLQDKPSKKVPQTREHQNMKSRHFVMFFGSLLPSCIRIQPTKTNADPDPQHFLQYPYPVPVTGRRGWSESPFSIAGSGSGSSRPKLMRIRIHNTFYNL